MASQEKKEYLRREKAQHWVESSSKAEVWQEEIDKLSKKANAPEINRNHRDRMRDKLSFLKFHFNRIPLPLGCIDQLGPANLEAYQRWLAEKTKEQGLAWQQGLESPDQLPGGQG